MKRSSWIAALAMLMLAAGLLTGPSGAGEGARQALSVCGRVLIPSLFPFLVLSVLVSSTEAGKLLTGPAAWLGRALYGAPEQAAPAVLMSWIGGYPSGAKALSQLLKDGSISRSDAEKTLCFCVNSGPAFLIAVVGEGIFGSVRTGMELYLCQLAAGVLTARLMLKPGWADRKSGTGRGSVLPMSRAVTAAVSSAAASMTVICGFVVFCGAVNGILLESGLLTFCAEKIMLLSGGRYSVRAAELLLRGMVEICGGVSGAEELYFREAARLLPFLVSFGGISVFFQIMACFPGEELNFSLFLRSRLVHGLLTVLLTLPLSGRWAAEAAMTGRPVPAFSGRSAVQGLCLIGMMAVCSLAAPPERKLSDRG